MAPKASKADKKFAYDQKLCQILDELNQILVTAADNVGSNQLQKLRQGLRYSVVLMGKNTMMKRSIRVHAENTGNIAFLNLIPLLVGNVGLIFTNGDLKEVSEEVAKYKVYILWTRKFSEMGRIGKDFEILCVFNQLGRIWDLTMTILKMHDSGFFSTRYWNSNDVFVVNGHAILTVEIQSYDSAEVLERYFQADFIILAELVREIFRVGRTDMTQDFVHFVDLPEDKKYEGKVLQLHKHAALLPADQRVDLIVNAYTDILLEEGDLPKLIVDEIGNQLDKHFPNWSLRIPLTSHFEYGLYHPKDPPILTCAECKSIEDEDYTSLLLAQYAIPFGSSQREGSSNIARSTESTERRDDNPFV